MHLKVESAAFLSQLNDLGAALQNNVTQAVRLATDAVYADAKATTLFKDRTGELRGSIKSSVEGHTGKVSRGRKAYMSFVANGTPPHIIPASGDGMLRFEMNGEVFFRRSVNHKGTTPRPFMQHASDVGERMLRPIVERFVESAIRRFNGR